MIIYDSKRLKYALLRTKLAVYPTQPFGGWSTPWHIKLKDLKDSKGRSAQLWIGRTGPGTYIRVLVTDHSVGCKKFSKEDMAKIFKAAGVKRGRKRTK